jgi:NADH dehydrogenase FAD-containing subunit
MGRHLVLVGGGHAHLATLKALGDTVSKGHRVTLISPSPYHYYSGMGPGMLSGMYQQREVRFNVKKMAENRGASFIENRVTRMIPDSRILLLEDGKSVHYDIASFNLGSEVVVDRSRARHDRIIPVKPIINLYRARQSILEEARKGVRIVIVGGGPAGIEVAANAWRLVHTNGKEAELTLIAGRSILERFPTKARHHALASLSAKGFSVREGIRLRSIEEAHLILSDGSALPYDYAFIAMGVKPSPMFRDSGLPVGEDGGLSVDMFLRCVGYPNLFGGGDCVSVAGYDLAKVGVHAVRQSLVLRHNLMAALDVGAMRAFTPKENYMLILNMGDGRGILCKRNHVWEGRLSFVLKNYVDERFMRTFQVSGERADP